LNEIAQRGLFSDTGCRKHDDLGFAQRRLSKTMTAALAHGNLQIGADGFRMLPASPKYFPVLLESPIRRLPR
jgi:hypothetical protein